MTTDISETSEVMYKFFDKRGYPVSVVEAGHHRAQQINRQLALQTAEKEKNWLHSIHSHILPSQPRS